MPSKIKRKRAMPSYRAGDMARRAAAEYCLLHYPTLYTAGIPQPASGRPAGRWIVPIVVTHPIHGVVGTVGELTFDLRGQKVVEQTPRATVLAAGKALTKGILHGKKAADTFQANQS